MESRPRNSPDLSVGAFAKALWRHFVVVVTGSSIAAALAVYSLISRQPVPFAGGLAVLALTVFVATFRAWQGELRSQVAIVDELRRERDDYRQRITELEETSLRLAITGVRAIANASIRAFIHIENPGPDISFRRDWRLRISTPDGTSLGSIAADASAEALAGGRASEIAITANDDRLAHIVVASRDALSVLPGVTLEVHGTDIRGRQLRALWSN